MTERGLACITKSVRSTSSSSLHFPEGKLLSPCCCIIWEEDKQESTSPSLGNAVTCPKCFKLPWETSPRHMLVCEVPQNTHALYSAP